MQSDFLGISVKIVLCRSALFILGSLCSGLTFGKGISRPCSMAMLLTKLKSSNLTYLKRDLQPLSTYMHHIQWMPTNISQYLFYIAVNDTYRWPSICRFWTLEMQSKILIRLQIIVVEKCKLSPTNN